MKTNTVVGLDIGAYAIRAVQVTKDLKGNFTVDKVGQEILPRGAVHEGEVLNQDDVVAALQRLWKKSRFTTKVVRMGVGDARTRSTTGQENWEEDIDFKTLLPRLPISDALTESIEDYYIDWHTLGEYNVREASAHDPDEKVTARKKFILLGAGNKEVVNSRVRAVLAAKLKPVSVDLNALALVRAYDTSRLESKYEDVDASVDMGADALTIVLHKLGQPLFIRVRKGYVGGAVTQAISESLQLNKTVAERRKLEHLNTTEEPGMPSPELSDGSKLPMSREATEQAEKAIERWRRIDPIVRESVANAINSIRETLDHFQGIAPGVDLYNLSGFSLSGMFSLTPSLSDRIEAEFGAPVVFSEPFTSFANEKKVSRLPEEIREAELAFTVAYGLATGEGGSHA